jgi:hypothetical protein
MTSLYAMRRANGDWYALDDKGIARVPVFRSSRDAILARSRDSGMECFRPVVLDQTALENLTTTDQGDECFWLVDDPTMKLSRGRRIDSAELVRLISNRGEVAAEMRRSANDLVVRSMRNDIATLENKVPELS